METIDKLAWLYLKDRALLATRSHGKALYYLPGGKREAGESNEAALIREIKEELTVDLDPATIAYVHTFAAQADGKPAGTLVRMTCYQGDFVGTITPSAEIAEVRFLQYADRPHCSLAAQLILDWLQEQGLLM